MRRKQIVCTNETVKSPEVHSDPVKGFRWDMKCARSTMADSGLNPEAGGAYKTAHRASMGVDEPR
ncbi:hypothetical protein VP1G_11302 [Cytospora mali]|uniref:Uncharacterized protein n=1 Tax=Cytospora mali TaxID=578113 RepID=A0A194VCG7_CYTMA|nr:hypothetical protein VP1G_11302 [Valsa mali var. pyri (nom. inval.)]